MLARELLHRRSRQAGETTEEREQASALIDGGLAADEPTVHVAVRPQSEAQGWPHPAAHHTAV